MKILCLSAFFVFNAFAFRAQPKINNDDGYTNPNNRPGREYYAAPGKQIWDEHGRPFWNGKIAKRISSYQKPLHKKVVKNVEKDSDNDGILDKFDQCKDTSPGARVNAFGCNLNSNVNLAVKFELGKAVLQKQYTDQLEKLADTLKSNENLKIEIQGHTDSTGNDKINRQLSQLYAEAVKNYLVQNMNVDSSRLRAIGYGSEKPIHSNETKTGRNLNRRVEASIIE